MAPPPGRGMTQRQQLIAAGGESSAESSPGEDFWERPGSRILAWLNGLSQWEQRALVAGALSLTVLMVVLMIRRIGGGAGGAGPVLGNSPFPRCPGSTPCPEAWKSGNGGGYFCPTSHGCRPGAQGPFPSCPAQCVVGNPPAMPAAVPAAGAGAGAAASGPAIKPSSLKAPGKYDLRVVKGSKLLGCAAPIGLFPGQPKYGCAGAFATAKTCDAPAYPVKDTQYVKAVHAGCETALGQGTYAYAYDDGVGLKQCSPLTKYEWVLCPTGQEGPIAWQAMQGTFPDSSKRFRVTNRCREPIWVEQAGPEGGGLPNEAKIVRIDAGSSYTYSIPNRGLASTRFLPKTGCDANGNYCEIQSMPPCPKDGCDLPVDTKFEASWGCMYWTGVVEDDKVGCTLTGQGNPSTYQDWWDGSAVDGWTLPFSIFVDDGGQGLAPGSVGSPDICGPVVCANLDAARLCPTEEFLTPVS